MSMTIPVQGSKRVRGSALRSGETENHSGVSVSYDAARREYTILREAGAKGGETILGTRSLKRARCAAACLRRGMSEADTTLRMGQIVP
jgi:hypothetical protein